MGCTCKTDSADGAFYCDSKRLKTDGAMAGANAVLAPAPAPNTYSVHTISQPCCHDSFVAGSPRFEQRFLVNASFWNNGSAGPVLFYSGNEGAIEGFATATGWQWELAQQVGALVVFAEHRGYGHSATSGECGAGFGHVTSGGALSDFARLAARLRSSWGAANSTIVAVGGSYGGMLAAWLRMRYGHEFDGALAASAPIGLGGEWKSSAVYDRVSSDFACAAAVGAAFKQLWAARSTAAGRSGIAKDLKVKNI